MLLESPDLKSQLKMFRKGLTGKAPSGSQSIATSSARDIGIHRLSQHKDSIQHGCSIDKLALEINSSLQITDSEVVERHGAHSVNLSFGENQSAGSKQSMGFAAVQSMDGRRKKSKTKR